MTNIFAVVCSSLHLSLSCLAVCLHVRLSVCNCLEVSVRLLVSVCVPVHLLSHLSILPESVRPAHIPWYFRVSFVQCVSAFRHPAHCRPSPSYRNQFPAVKHVCSFCSHIHFPWHLLVVQPNIALTSTGCLCAAQRNIHCSVAVMRGQMLLLHSSCKMITNLLHERPKHPKSTFLESVSLLRKKNVPADRRPNHSDPYRTACVQKETVIEDTFREQPTLVGYWTIW